MGQIRALSRLVKPQDTRILNGHHGDVPNVTIEVDPSLRFLLPRHDRGDHVVRDVAPTETVAHLLQVVGVPLTEVGDARVDGTRIHHPRLRETHIRDSSVIEVEARERPQPNTGRFLLDAHLGTLARRMRLLGIDAAYESDADDSQLALRSTAENREMLTRDRALLFRKAVHDGALIRSDDVDAQLDEVLTRFRPPLAPWTRCLRCGALLAEVAADDVAARLQPGTRRTYRDFSQCTGCAQVYWRGAHSERLEAVVRRATERG